MTIDTAGLEKTFREMGESMREVFTSQQIFNRTMKDTLEASTKAQEKQTEALEKLNVSTKQRDHDHMFATIKPYDGKDSKKFDAWIEQIMTACKISGRNPKLVALAKSTGAVTEVILSMKQKVTWVEFVEELRRCFSDSKTRVHAAAIYNEFRRQDNNENLRSYCCDMDQSDTIGKIELIPSIVLSSDNTDCKNDIQLFPQLFDELSVHTDYH